MSATKKRKASEFMEDQPTNSSSKKPKIKKGRKAKSNGTPAAVDPPPFQVICPFQDKPGFVKSGMLTKLSENFEWDYGVKSLKSDRKWEDMKTYKHVKLGNSTYTQGDIVYVLNNDNTVPPDEDATEQELLKWDQDNCWVGKIIQTRANDPVDVFVLVAWLYWTKEIPTHQKKQPHFYQQSYAEGELIMSNWLDVIDATSVSGKADIYAWDENDDTSLAQAPERFWRQTFNAGLAAQTPKSSTALSPLRKFCTCERPYNPDHPMFFCSAGTCKNWNHRQCLVDNIWKQVAKSYKEGTMDEYARNNAPQPPSFVEQVVSDVKSIGQALSGVIESGIAEVKSETTVILESTNGASDKKLEDVEASFSILGKRGRPKKTADPKSPNLRIEIVTENNPDQAPSAIITDNVSDNVWEVAVDCLCCGQIMM